MPFEPGKSGNPSGRQKHKPWREALDRVLAQLEVKDKEGVVVVKAGDALRAIAERVVLMALAGDKDAYREVASRQDGSADQNLSIDIDTAGVEALSVFGEFMAQAAGRQEAPNAQAVDTGGSVLPVEVRPTSH